MTTYLDFFTHSLFVYSWSRRGIEEAINNTVAYEGDNYWGGGGGGAETLIKYS